MAHTAAAFKVDYFQFLKPDGKLVADQQVPALAKDFDRLSELYKLMVLTRTFDKKAVALQRTGKLGTYASSLGHEAAHVAVGASMRKEDCFAPMYREYGAQFYRGVKMSEVLLYWGGDERGSDFSGARTRLRLVRTHRHPVPARGRRGYGLQTQKGRSRGRYDRWRRRFFEG